MECQEIETFLVLCESRFAAQFRAAEDLVKDSGLDWTILRLADFDANALAW